MSGALLKAEERVLNVAAAVKSDRETHQIVDFQWCDASLMLPEPNGVISGTSLECKPSRWCSNPDTLL
jgi:hypothetical protein